MTYVRPAAPVLALAALITLAACGGADAPDASSADTAPPAGPEASPAPGAGVAALLANGQAVFGQFGGEKTREQGASMPGSTEADFLLYSMESGPFDVPLMVEYLEVVSENMILPIQ